MYPILFEIGNITIYTYGTILYINLIISIFLATKFATKFEVDKDKVFVAIFIVVLFLYLGGKISYTLFNQNNKDFMDFLVKVIIPTQSGLTILGAIAFSIIGIYLSSVILKLNFLRLADLLGFISPLSLSIGRIGCLMAGCCYGKESSWGIFLHGAVRYPTQAMESFLSLILFVYFLFISKKQKYFEGKYFFGFIMGYSVIRFIVEFYRESKVVFLGLSWAQIFSIIFAIFSLMIFLKIKKAGDKK